MKVHSLKTHRAPFQAIVDGLKTFEVRKDDRGFQEGDVLHLREWAGHLYTGRSIVCTVTYLLRASYGIERGHVVMGIVREDEEPRPITDERVQRGEEEADRG